MGLVNINKWRQRSPSYSTIAGITKIKKNLRKATGINAIARWNPSRVAQRVKQKVGWYKPILRKIRAIKRGNFFNVGNIVPKGGE